LNADMCKFESPQKHESRAQLANSSKAGIGNLLLVADQKQTLQGMAGRTNFLPTISYLCCL